MLEKIHCKAVWQFLKKLNAKHNPFIQLYPSEVKTYDHTKACMGMFVLVLYLNILNQKWCKYLPAGEWINKIHGKGILFNNRKK